MGAMGVEPNSSTTPHESMTTEQEATNTLITDCEIRYWRT